MRTTAGLPCFFLTLLPLLVSVGVYLLVTGLRPRRRGTAPHCGRCGYNLTGLSSERCPECGMSLIAGSIVQGEGRRNPRRVAAGFLCLAPAAVLLIAPLRTVDWYSWSPTSWLISDLQGPRAIRAWNEIDRRRKTGKLSQVHRARLVGLGLKRQIAATSTPIDEMLLDLLGEWAIEGTLTQQQLKQLCSQAATVTFSVRPKVRQGDDVPCQFSYRGNAPRQLWVRIEENRVCMNGKDLTSGSSSSGFSGRGNRGGTTQRVRYRRAAPGPQDIEANVTVRVFDGPETYGSSGPAPRLLDQYDIPLKASFVIVARTPESAITLKPDPSLREAMESAIQVQKVELGRQSPNDLQVQIRLITVPANLAFDVIVRAEGHEQRLGGIDKERGGSTGWHVSGDWKGPPMESCDVILRSNPDVAAGTITLFEIWEGELVYRDVPVSLGPKAATRLVERRMSKPE